MKAVRSFQDLEVWQRAVDLATQVYQVAKKFPASEQFGLTSQIQRAGISVASNIAEGWGRGTTREFIQFLRIAKGSLVELETHLIIAHRLGYLSEEALRSLREQMESISRMLVRLSRSLKQKDG